MNSTRVFFIQNTHAHLSVSNLTKSHPDLWLLKIDEDDPTFQQVRVHCTPFIVILIKITLYKLDLP